MTVTFVENGRYGSPGTANGQFRFAYGLCSIKTTINSTPVERVVVSDAFNNAIKMFKYDPSNGSFALTAKYAGTLGTAVNQLNAPFDVAVDDPTSTTPYLYVADTANHRVVRLQVTLTADGTGESLQFAGTIGEEGTSPNTTNMKWPYSIDAYKPNSATNDTTLFVSNTYGQNWLKLPLVVGPNNTLTAPDAITTGEAGRTSDSGSLMMFPSGITVDKSTSGNTRGTVYVSDSTNCRILKYTTNGDVFTESWGRFANTPAHTHNLTFPYDLEVMLDSNGAAKQLLVADTFNSRVYSINIADGSAGGTHGDFGTGQDGFWLPCGITALSHDTVFVANTFDNEIVRLTVTGV